MVVESIDHLFGNCSFASNVWSHSFSDHSALSFSNGFSNWLDNLRSCFAKDSGSLPIALITAYNIWYTRNLLIFQGKSSDPAQVSHMSQAMAYGYRNANFGSSSMISNNDNIVKWVPPSHPFVKINFDGFVQGSSGATGFVIRDANGSPLFADSNGIGTSHVLVSESLALREALCHALAGGFDNILVEGDSKILIDCLMGHCSIPWRILLLVEDIRWLANRFSRISFEHILREANFVVDVVAAAGQSCGLCSWTNSLPLSAANVLRFHLLGVGCVRGFSL